MEEQSSSHSFGTMASPDLSPTSSHIQDSRHDEAHGIRISPEDSYAGELHCGASNNHPGREQSGAVLRDQQVLVSEKSGTHPGESNAIESDRRSLFRAEELTRERRDAEYHAEEHTHRMSYRVERHRSSSYTVSYRSRVSSERHRDRSESSRRRRRSDEHWYREEHERRRRSLRPASLGYFLRRRYSSLSFAVSRSHSRSGVLYRRTTRQPARRAYGPVRSTESDRRSTQQHRVRSLETVPREGDGWHGSAMSTEQEPSRVIETDPPIEDGVNSEPERVIPKVQLAEYHLEDPRREDYAPGFRRNLHLQQYELIDLTVPTHEQHYGAQLYGSGGGSLERHGQIPSSSARPPISRTCTLRSSDIYHRKNRYIAFLRRHNLHRCNYLGQEGPDVCARCSRPVESLVNYGSGGSRPEEYLVSYCPVGPRPEECLVNYCPKPLDTARSMREASEAGVPYLRGPHVGGNEQSPCFQTLRRRGNSMMRQLPPDGERTWFDFPRELADRIVEAMVHTIRVQSNEVDALRADMRDLRIRMASFVADEKKAQEKSLSFIAAIKQRMAEQN
uniref:Uncharacterized protein n=1 Tax=Rhipicephalus zambeziensis TaxID=60191 RepID=A0A224Y615_9ACAR